MADNREKRRFPRLDSTHLISYTHFDDTNRPDEMGMGRTLDLSQGGVTIQAHRAFPVNTGLEMVIALEEKLIRAKGRVVHARAVGKELYDLGVCFTEIQESDRLLLMEFFQKISPTEGPSSS
jgi:c-di-GMP-binding flagellar brake protein YcgR